MNNKCHDKCTDTDPYIEHNDTLGYKLPNDCHSVECENSVCEPTVETISNFNFGNQPEYNLHSDLIDELIRLYGIQIKFIVAERVGEDNVVFGDFSHLLTDGTRTFEISALPENTEDFEVPDYRFSQFGLNDLNEVNLFIHRNSVVDILGVRHHIKNNEKTLTKQNTANLDLHLIGNLVVLPSGKVFEITNQSIQVPGINNLYTFKNVNSVYMITCVPYRTKLVSEVDDMDRSTMESDEQSVDAYMPGKSLEDYFSELEEISEMQDSEFLVHDHQPIQKSSSENPQNPQNNESFVPYIDNSEKSAWD